MDIHFKSDMLNVCNDAVPIPPSPELQHRQTSSSEENHTPIRPLRKKDRINMQYPQNVSPQNCPINGNVNTISSGTVINIIKSQGIHFGPEIVYNFGSNDTERKSDPEIAKTDDILNLMDSKFEITHEYMDLISKQMGEGWRSVFRNMGFEDGSIELIYESNHHKGIPEVIYQMLLDWTRADNRTLGELCTILWNEQKYTLVQNVSTIFDASNKEKS